MNNRLKELREKLGMKQREIAEKLEVPPTNVSGWEGGSRPISKGTIYKYCKEFNVRRAWLETGEGEMFAPKKEKTVEEAMDDFVEAVARAMTDEQRDVVAKLLQRAADEMERDEKKWKPE